MIGDKFLRLIVKNSLFHLKADSISYNYHYTNIISLSNKKESFLNGMMIFSNRLVAISSCIGTIGILYSVDGWRNSDYMTLSGCTGLVITLLFIIYLKRQYPELKSFPARLILRIFVIAALGFALNYAPKEELAKVGIVKHVSK